MEFDDLVNDLGELREITVALNHIWDVPVLTLLARRPLRFMAIRRLLGESAAHRPDTKVLDRALKRLIRQRYIRRLGSDHLSPYDITGRGRRLLVRIRAIIDFDREQRRKLGDNGTGDDEQRET